jgi:hypothetical protein
VVGSGAFNPILGTVPDGDNGAVVASGVFNPMLEDVPGGGLWIDGAVVGSGVFDPILGTVPGGNAGRVVEPMLGTVWGGGGQACAKADLAPETSPAPRTKRNTTTFAKRVRGPAPMADSPSTEADI